MAFPSPDQIDDDEKDHRWNEDAYNDVADIGPEKRFPCHIKSLRKGGDRLVPDMPGKILINPPVSDIDTLRKPF
jgi:hypothetical protein